MTGLLVSVRDAVEASAACEAGADLIDVKEPSLGSLGAASPAVWREVLAAVAGRAPTSVALGELRDVAWPGRTPADADGSSWRAADGVRYAKLGLAGCGRRNDWERRWRTALELFPADATPVAVIYADFEAADSPPPEQVLAAARRTADGPSETNRSRRCGAVLFDTYCKKSGDLFAVLDGQRLTALCAEVRSAGLRLVLAGSLRGESIARALDLEPDYVAVRGAACVGARDGRLDGRLVAQLSSQVRTFVRLASP